VRIPKFDLTQRQGKVSIQAAVVSKEPDFIEKFRAGKKGQLFRPQCSVFSTHREADYWKSSTLEDLANCLKRVGGHTEFSWLKGLCIIIRRMTYTALDSCSVSAFC